MRHFPVISVFAGLLLLTADMSWAEPASSPWVTREEIIKAVADTFQQEFGHILPGTLDAKVKVSGEVRAAMGIESHGDLVFTRANMDLNERNWRILSDKALNNRQNTFDPAVYSRIKLIVDATVDAVAMHLNVTVDPWSYTGKTSEQTVVSSWGDSANVQHLFWGNNGYTFNHSVNTQRLGGTLNFPEVKVKDGRVASTAISSTICNEFGQCDTFTTPEMKIDYTFQPVRELWFDIKPGDTGKIRIFPMAYEDQALTTDDPLRLSNNKSWWEESPWIDDWRPGQVNVGVPAPVDFTRGRWDRGIAFAARDSGSQRLTALRGIALDVKPTEDTTVQATVATPKTLWQEYSEVTAIPGSMRVKQFVGDQAYVGATGNMHLGLVEGKVDKENYVGSIDAGVAPDEHVKMMAQVSMSESRNDLRSRDYRSRNDGQAYYASLEAISNAVDILKTDYLSQRPAEGGGDFYKTRILFARMDKGFESSLSNYHVTRNDAYWSRHLTFYPSIYRKMPGIAAGMGEEDQKAFAIGSGLDYGRNVAAWRADATLLDGRLEGMGDIRHVTTNEGRKVEDVARTEWSHKTTDRLTTKAIALWHSLPSTRLGEDAFITDSDTGEYLLNSAVEGGKDRDLKTGALGARYQLTDWADINGVWEYSNDMTLARDNFPRGLFDGLTTSTYACQGRVCRKNVPYLYDQGFFDQAPYEYHHIFKTGLHLQPVDIWDLYFDYTRNPNKFAGNIDDNVNHFGVETSIIPNKHLGFFARYTMTQGYDLNRLNKDKQLDYRAYHNVFLESRYLSPKEHMFSLQYGVGPAYFVETSSTNPELGFYAVPVLSTEHMIRLIYEKKF